MSAELSDSELGLIDEQEFLANVVPQVLTFILGDEVYGLSIDNISEIIGAQTLTPIPDPRPFMKGVINLRGTVIPVMDVRQRLSMAPRENDRQTCIIVVRQGEVVVGLMVDTISDVIDVPANTIEAAPRRKSASEGSSVVTGLVQRDGKVKILIDLDRLLSNPDSMGGSRETEMN